MPFHNSPFFRSTRYPSLLGGQRRSGMRGFAQHLYTRSNFSDLRELVTLPCATICVRQTASLYQQVLHCHSGSVVSSTGRHQTVTPYMPLVRQRREQRSPALGVRCLDHSTTTAEMFCSWSRIMDSNPTWIELWVLNPSVLNPTCTKHIYTVLDK